MKSSSRIPLSLLLCVALLFATAITPGFSMVSNGSDWEEYITRNKTATVPGFTSGPRETVVTLEVSGTAPEITPMLDIVLVLDRSKSMDKSRMDALKNAAVAFSEDMLNGPNNKIAVVSYGSAATLDQAFTNEYDDVEAAILAINTSMDSGYTNMHEGMLRANEVMTAGARLNANKIIVFMTDGVPNTYLDGEGDPVYTGIPYDSDAAKAFQDEAAVAKAAKITVITVGLLNGMTGTELTNAVNNLETAASKRSDTTPMFYQASAPDSLSAIYALIGATANKLIGDDVEIFDYVPDSFNLVADSFEARVDGRCRRHSEYQFRY